MAGMISRIHVSDQFFLYFPLWRETWQVTKWGCVRVNGSQRMGDLVTAYDTCFGLWC